ncbi:MAG TPA: hypothetical protein VGL53_21630, partial [Bryobacteraceae bacterium]
MRALAKIELIAAIVAFGLIFVCGYIGQLAVGRGYAKAAVDTAVHGAILALFVIFGFCLIGLLLHVFIVLQVRMGNGAEPMVRFLYAHETALTLAVWGFLRLGTLVALPAILQNMMGFEEPVEKSHGALVADIGMTFDEVRQRSTFPVQDGSAVYGGRQLAHETVVFDYRIGDSGMQFPQSRYYWLESRKEDPRRIVEINIGITPRKLPKPDLLAFQDRVRDQLVKDGWMPGHYIADSEKTITLWAGKRTTGEGRYWLRRNTVLILETNRVDEEVKDEPPGSGAFILYI